MRCTICLCISLVLLVALLPSAALCQDSSRGEALRKVDSAKIGSPDVHREAKVTASAGETAVRMTKGLEYYVEPSISIFGINPGARYLAKYESHSRLLTFAAVEKPNVDIPSLRLEADFSASGFVTGGRSYSLKRIGGALCVVDSAESCVARVFGPAVDPADFLGSDPVEEAASVISTAAHSSVGAITRSMSYADADFAACPDRRLRQNFTRVRGLADELEHAAFLLPYVADPRIRPQLRMQMVSGSALLLRLLADRHENNYSECFRGTDVQTGLTAIKALYEAYKLDRNPAYRARIFELWADARRNFNVHAYMGANVNDMLAIPSYSAGGVGLYLEAAVIIEKLGGHGLEAWTRTLVRTLQVSQFKVPPRTGSACGSYQVLYGGWVHDARDCTQKMGYHLWSVGGLVSTYEYLLNSSKSLCTLEWREQCESIKYNIIAGIGWIDQLEHESGAIDDRAVGSGPTGRKIGNTGAGTAPGAAMFFWVFSQLANLNRDTAPVEVSYTSRKSPRELKRDAVRALQYTKDHGLGLRVVLGRYLEYENRH